MHAYKFLTADRRSAITGFAWPESAWVEAAGRLELCRNGVHACRIEHLPHWIGAELWAVELGGEIQEGPDAVLARRGRLVARVSEWADGVNREFGHECAQRAKAVVGDEARVVARAADAAANAMAGWVSAAAYIAAAVAAQVGSGVTEGPVYDEHFRIERARQGAWLKQRLGLSEP